MRTKLYKSVFIFLLVFISGCLEDNINGPQNINLESGAMLLKYFERNGDYINTREAPSLVEAKTVYDNLQNYIVIDIRSSEQFNAGHIEGAKNVLNTVLIDSVKKYEQQNVVIVSQDGQASAYYTCLLHLYGFNNVYTMNFGMAYWNRDFAAGWISATRNDAHRDFYTNADYERNEYGNLPVVFESSGDIDSLAKKRITSFVERGFVDTKTEVPYDQTATSLYLVCYAGEDLYYYPPKYGTTGHPVDTKFYMAGSSLMSVKFLQTLPSGQDILIYDYNGQLSTAAVAYLRVMGYQAYTLLYGYCHLDYERMTGFLPDYAFRQSQINNLPYVTTD